MEVLRKCIDAQSGALVSLRTNFLEPLRNDIAAMKPRDVTLAAHARVYRLEHLLKSAMLMLDVERAMLTFIGSLKQEHVQPLGGVVSTSVSTIGQETQRLEDTWLIIGGQTPFDAQTNELLGKALEARIAILHGAIITILQVLQNISAYITNNRSSLNNVTIPLQLGTTEIAFIRVQLPPQYPSGVATV